MSSFYQECKARVNDLCLTTYQSQEVMDMINEYNRLLEAFRLLTNEEMRLELLKRKLAIERERISIGHSTF